MKQFYKSKSLPRLSFLFVLLFSVITVVNSCKKDDDEGYQDHLVQFEVKASAGGVIKTIVTQIGTSQNTMYNTTQTPLTSPWTSGEIFVNSSQAQLNLDANADMPNTDSELIINLWIDGNIVKTDKKVGKGVLTASIDYSFLEL
ncbi:hypothetical protein [Chryseobacterium sp. PMSZPI]|uniref:hypothetical protein n=1 Tax=Chryseobacterium sp. PMSZPI TaxID=1033900 RepID=UPI001E4E321F|nr:hypothetical protein [Chryseobacterium sp. PMSZPI]